MRCVMRVSIRLYTNRIRDSCGPRGWRRTDVHRCAPVAITAERTSASSAGDHGSNSPCSPHPVVWITVGHRRSHW